MKLLAFNDLVQRFAAAARASSAVALDFTVGSIFRAIAEANASLGLWLQWLVLIVLQKTRLATATGADADSFVADFGLARLPAVASTGLATFSRLTTGAPAIIPVGATAKTTDGTQTFTVTTDTTNPAWNGSGYALTAAAPSVTVPMASTSSGSATNILAGTLTVLTSAIAGVDSVTNAVNFTGGANAESDAALRTRFPLWVNSRSKATPAAMAYAVISTQQGLTYALVENATPDGGYRPGYVTIAVDDGSGAPPQALLNRLYAAVDLVRGASIAFSVVPPQVLPVTVSMILTAAPGYTKSALIGPVQQAILAYIGALGIGQPLPYSKLGALAYSIPGVANAASILLNGGTADVGGGPVQAVRTTSASVTVS